MSCTHDCDKPPVFPQPIFNRAALDRIAYRIGSYAELREHMLDLLNKSPELAAWTHRAADDPGIALLEGTAEVGDILTFYQQLYANEAFLRTAQWQQSVVELVQLTGYRLAPGVGGLAEFALTVKGERPITVPKGFAFKAQLKGEKQPAQFESISELIAYPALNQFSLYQPRSGGGAIDKNDVINKLELVAVNNAQDASTLAALRLNSGDRLMIVPDTSVFDVDGTAYSEQEAAEILVVSEVETVLDRVIIHFEGSLTVDRSSSVTAYPINRSFRHFGHNAPVLTNIYNSSKRAVTQERTKFKRLLDAKQAAPANRGNYYTELEATAMPLDSEVGDLAAGALLICEGSISFSGYSDEPFTVTRTIDAVSAGALVWGNQSGSTSVVTLQDQPVLNSKLVNPSTDLRGLRLHEVTGPKLTLRSPSRWTTGSFTDATLNFYGSADEVKILAGRALLFVHQDGRLESHTVSQQPAIVAAYSAPPKTVNDKRLWSIVLTLAPNLQREDFSEHEPQVTVYGNLVNTTEGKTEDQVVLGSGDRRSTFQTFALPKSPLTYLLDQSRNPPQLPELQVYVDNILWKRVDTFFNYGPSDQVYVVREDSDGKSWVQFGDGNSGARLPSGQNNVVALYRTGVGAAGPLEQGQKAKAADKLADLDKVFMPIPASGGGDPEDQENARQAAPGRMQSLGRLVALADFEAEALALPGVLKVRATWAAPNGTAHVRLTVLSKQAGTTATETVRKSMQNANRCRGPARFPIIVAPGRRQYIYLEISTGYDSVRRQSDLEIAIQQALGVCGEEGNGIDGSKGLFGLRTRSFGGAAHISQIIAVVQQVAGINWVKLSSAQIIDQSGLTSVDPLTLAKPASPKLQTVLACDRDYLLALHRRHLNLVLQVDQRTEECSS